MIVVAIIGLLSSVALPAFVKYVRRAKTTEALLNIRKLWDSSLAYYSSDRGSRTGGILAKQFPATQSTTPPLGTCCTSPGSKCSPSLSLWETTTWRALNFSIDDPYYYSYAYAAAGSGRTSSFTAGAYGDLDCDNQFSTFERTGKIDSQGNVTGGAGLYIRNDIE